MPKLFFKTFFYTSLAIAIIIAVLTIFSSTFYRFTDMLAAAVYPSEEGISTIVAAFFPIAATVLCGLLALLVAALTYAIRKKPIAAPPKKNKLFLYYFIALTVVSLLVLHSCLLGFVISVHYISLENVALFALLYGACVVEALAIAAFLVSLFTLWKTNKLVACIIGVIILLIIPATYISGYAVHEMSYNAYYDDGYDYSYIHSSDSVVEDDSEADTPEEYPEEHIDSDYLSFLWNENENDNVSNTFAYLFQKCLSSWTDNSNFLLFYICDKIAVFGYGIDEKDWSVYDKERDIGFTYSNAEEKLAEGMLRKAYYYLKENPSEILSSFYSYQNMIYQYMPIEKFYGTGAEDLLNQLIAAHDDLYSDADLSRLQKIYKLMTNIEHEYVYEYYDDIKLHINDSYLSYFYDKDGELYQGGVVWAYSFWARRNAEGIDDIAYTILNTLQEYYSEAEYYFEEEYQDEEVSYD